MKRLTGRDEFGNADIIALSDIMPELYAELSFSETNALTDTLNQLAAYEDTGLTPEEVEALKADNDRLHKLLDEIEEVVIAKPKETSDEERVHCRDCGYLNMDSGKPYCCHSHMSTSGLDDWCDHAKRKDN